jgi:hypothetical protein
MTRKLSRTGIAALFLAGTALAGSSLPAQAMTQARPGPIIQKETLYTFYNNAQHTTVIGYAEYGCTTVKSGSESSYYTVIMYSC